MASSIILASQSPRRKELLGYIVPSFNVASADIDETPNANEDPVEYVKRLAKEKAQAVAREHGNATIIGSDTSVVVDHIILGKPIDKADFTTMMERLSDRVHQVVTGYCVYHQGQYYTEVVTTDVQFKSLTAQDIDDYWSTSEPIDKAGGYAIQGIGGRFVVGVNGSVSSVVGLPLVELERLLKKLEVL